MQKQLRSAIALLLTVAMLCVVPVFGVQAEDAYTAQLDYSAGIYLISDPHKIAQEFVPDFDQLQSVKAYLEMDADNVVTLSICTNVETAQAETVYTEDFIFDGAANGWVQFDLSSAVNLTQGERYSLVLTTTRRAVWYGKLSNVADLNGCCVLNYDEAAYSGWMRELHGVAFELIPVPTSYQQVIDQISALPDEITLSDAAQISAARRAYDALSIADQKQVSNYAILTAAETKLAELKAHTFVGQSDYSTALFQIKQPSAAGQEFIPDFANLTKVSAYLQVESNCDITLKITSDITTAEPQELYTETFSVEAMTGWASFLLTSPVLLNENQRYEFTLSSTDGVVMFGKGGTSEGDAAGCCALNGENGWNRFTDYQTAFQVEGTEIEEYQKLIRKIIALPQEISLSDEATVTALLAEYAALSAEDQQKVSNFERLIAASNAIGALKLQARVDALIANINLLPAADQLALSDEAAVLTLRAEYDALPDDARQKVDNYETLAAAEARISQLKAEDSGFMALIQKIDALPETISIFEKGFVESLLAQYNALSAEDQAKVTNYDKLSAAEDRILDIIENIISPDDSPFTYQLDFSTALYLLTGPDHAAGQEFVPDFTELTAVVAYLDISANNILSLTISQDTTSDETVLYTEDFSVEAATTGWYKFELSQSVPVTVGEKYDVTITSTDRAVWFGKLSNLTDQLGNFALNYDITNPAYGGWVREMHTVAFQAVGKEMAPYDLLILKINQLPSEITLKQETTVSKLRNEYDALSKEDQQKVTNYNLLEAAEARIAELQGIEQEAEVAQAIEMISAIGTAITPKSYQAIFTADQAVTNLVEKYGKDVTEKITNYAALNQARADYNAFIHSYVCGDINADGGINATDALLALQHSVHLSEITGVNVYAADVNGDDKIDATDALLILQHSVKISDTFPAQPEEIILQTSENQALFEATYQSLIDRTTESGYANTSITGAYPGMFVRDTSIQILSHVACGDFEQAKKILQYTLLYHQIYNYDYALHVMNNNTGPISSEIQADTTFFLLHAWYQFAANAPDTVENSEFIELFTDKVKTFADYFFDNGYFNDQLGLLRNPSLEHSRDGAYFNAYDLLTNVYASQALHELSLFFQKSDPDNAKKWGNYADQIAEGIHTHLTAEVDGKMIYAEMQSINKKIAKTGQLVEDDSFYIGFSWVNMAPAGAGWYAVDQEIMNNTYEKYLQYGSITYYREYQMLEVVTTFHSPEDYRVSGNHVIGKGLAWELMFCYDTGRYERVRELIRFLEKNSDNMYRETWGYGGGGSDTANQEHASWMIIANEYVCHFSDS